MTDYWKHPLCFESYEIPVKWENMFEFNDDEEIIEWVMENVTESFFLDFCDYYFSVGFSSDIDAMAYKLRWC